MIKNSLIFFNARTQYEFIKLDETTNPSQSFSELLTTQGGSSLTSLVGQTVTGQSSSIVATILEAVAADGSDKATLYVKYTDTQAAQSSSDVVTRRMQAAEDLNVSGGGTLKVKTDNIGDLATGRGTQVTLRSGIYYARGNFVFTQDQSKIISKYTDDPDTKIGFKAVEEVITASDNNAL